MGSSIISCCTPTTKLWSLKWKVGRRTTRKASCFPCSTWKSRGWVKIVSIQWKKDKYGRPANTSKYDIQALGKGREDAPVALENTWERAKALKEGNPDVRQVWTYTAFCHCTVTAPKGFYSALGSLSNKLMTTMDPYNPLVAELNKLENAKRWLETDPKGDEAIERKSELMGKIRR